jgi:hypothetical protein
MIWKNRQQKLKMNYGSHPIQGDSPSRQITTASRQIIIMVYDGGLMVHGRGAHSRLSKEIILTVPASVHWVPDAVRVV